MSTVLDFPVMHDATWLVSAVGIEAIVVVAPNWVTALGLVLHRLGPSADVGSLACEVLGNGTAIAHDFRHHRRYVVRKARAQDLDEPAAQAS